MTAMTFQPKRWLPLPLTRAMALIVALTLGLGASPLSAQTALAPPAPAADAQTGMQTIAVVALNGYDDLLADVNYIGGLFGRPESGQMIEGMVAMFTQGRGIVGLDKSRPIGVVVAADGDSVTPVGCLPINDLDAVLEIVEGFGVMPADAGDGVTELELPDQTLYLKSGGEWVFFADNPDALDSTPGDPGELLGPVSAEYDLGAMAMVQSIPEEAREELIDALREGMEMGLQQQPGESDEQHELRVKLAEIQVEQISDMISGLDVVTVGLNIDAEGQATKLDLSITAVPDSMIHTAFKSYDGIETNQRGFHRPDAAMTLLAAGTNPPELIEQQREQLEAMINMFRKQIDQAIDEQSEIELSAEQRETLKSAAADMMDAYEAMAFAGKSDLGGSIEFVEGELSFIAAATLEKPEKLESALKKLVEVLESEPDFPAMAWDADSLGDVAMHRLSVPLPPDALNAAPILGEVVDFTIGFGPNAVYLATGPKGAEDMKAAINASKSSAGPLEHPAEMLISVDKILRVVEPYADAQAAPILDSLMTAFEELPEDSDQISFRVIRIDNGALLRYEINEGILKAAGKAVEAQGRAAAGGDF